MLGSNHVAEMDVYHIHGVEVLRHAVDVDLEDVAMHEQLAGSGRYLGGVLVVELWLISMEEHFQFDDYPCYARWRIVVAFWQV